MTASTQPVELQSFLDQITQGDASLAGACAVIAELAATGAETAELIGLGRLYGAMGASTESTNSDGDV